MSAPALMTPGYTLAPAAFTTVAPDGTDTFAPTASMRLPLMTIVPLAMTGPDTGTMRALVMAQVDPAALRATRNGSGAADGRGSGGPVAAAGVAAGGAC